MQRFHELSLRQLVGGTFDHDDVGLVADVNEVEVAVETLGLRWVDDELTIDAADAHGTDGAREGNVGDAERGGGAVHGADIRIVLAVGAEEDGDDLGVVVVAFREERAQRAVRHAAGENFLFRGAAFALEVTTGEAACGGGFFLVLDGEGEEVLAVLHFRGGDGGDEDDGVTETHGDGAVGEFGKFAGFDLQGSSTELDVLCVDSHGGSVFWFVCLGE